jgi:uncharacterized protein YdeI (BOF family)
MMPQVVHADAFAALEPIEGVSGWGRIAVRDSDLPSGFHRMLHVWLFGMEPGADYTVFVDGLEIGTLTTRPSGSAVLKLQNRGRGHDPVSENLPPAGALVSAVVEDAEGATILEGSFSAFVRTSGATIYEEEIELEDVHETGANGMAKVEMQEGGHEEFTTHASGLEPGATYSVVVDGLLPAVATVTVDHQGQARVQLEYPDDENPLPDDLRPVSEIVTVQWLNAEEVTILQGSFTGLGDCGTVHGTVTELTADGFVLDTDDGEIAVIITPETKWDDFDGHELAVDDVVKVQGCWDNDTLIASEIELKGGEEECGAVVGTIEEAFADGSFAVRRGGRLIQVATTTATSYEGFGDRDPAAGDFVKVEGCWDGDRFVAAMVELKRGTKLHGLS